MQNPSAKEKKKQKKNKAYFLFKIIISMIISDVNK